MSEFRLSAFTHNLAFVILIYNFALDVNLMLSK